MSFKFSRAAATVIAVLAMSQSSSALGFLKVLEPNTYKKAEWNGYGYKDSMRSDNAWDVSARSHRREGYMFSQQVALYRSAEIARDAGKSHFSIVRHNTFTINGGYRDMDEQTNLIILLSNSPDSPSYCMEDNPKACRTLNVSDTLQTIGSVFVASKRK